MMKKTKFNIVYNKSFCDWLSPWNNDFKLQLDIKSYDKTSKMFVTLTFIYLKVWFSDICILSGFLFWRLSLRVCPSTFIRACILLSVPLFLNFNLLFRILFCNFCLFLKLWFRLVFQNHALFILYFSSNINLKLLISF